MLDGEFRAAAVIAGHGVHAADQAVDDDDGRPARVRRRAGAGGRDQDERVDLAAQQRLDVGCLGRGIVVRVSQDHRVSPIRGNLLDLLRQLSKERIGDVGNHQAESMRALASEAARERVGPIGETLHRLHHPRPKFRRDGRMTVDDSRRGAHRDARLFGDFLDSSHDRSDECFR